MYEMRSKTEPKLVVRVDEQGRERIREKMKVNAQNSKNSILLEYNNNTLLIKTSVKPKYLQIFVFRHNCYSISIDR